MYSFLRVPELLVRPPPCAPLVRHSDYDLRCFVIDMAPVWWYTLHTHTSQGDIMEKKRYQLTLDRESVEQLQYYMHELGMPSGSFSALINAALPTMVNIYASLYQKRQVGGGLNSEEFMSTIFHAMADTLDKPEAD